MSITIELPDEMERRVREIPDLQRRVAEFLREQAGLEQWRQRRHTSRAGRVLKVSRADAAALSAAMSREELFEQFFAIHDRLGSAL